MTREDLHERLTNIELTIDTREHVAVIAGRRSGVLELDMSERSPRHYHYQGPRGLRGCPCDKPGCQPAVAAGLLDPATEELRDRLWRLAQTEPRFAAMLDRHAEEPDDE